MPACQFYPGKEREGKLPHREERLKLFHPLFEKSLLILNMCSLKRKNNLKLQEHYRRVKTGHSQL